MKLPIALDMLDIDSFIAAMSIPPPPEHFRTSPIITEQHCSNSASNISRSVSLKPAVKTKPTIKPFNLSNLEPAAIVQEDCNIPLWKQLLTPTSSPIDSLPPCIECPLNSAVPPITSETSTSTRCSTLPRHSSTPVIMRYKLPPPPEEIRDARSRHLAPVPPRRHSSLEAADCRHKPVPPPRRGSKLIKDSDIIYDHPQVI